MKNLRPYKIKDPNFLTKSYESKNFLNLLHQFFDGLQAVVYAFEILVNKIIFDKFRQSEAASKNVNGGVGLRFSISKALVEILGGENGLSSKPGEGALFYFVFPNITL